MVMDDSDMFGVTHSMIVCGHVHAFLTLGAGVPHTDKHANARQIELTYSGVAQLSVIIVCVQGLT